MWKAGALPMRLLGSASASIDEFHSFKSAPALKARPFPVMMATERLGSASSHFHTASISHCAVVFIQLRSLGRFMVMRRTRGAG